MTEIQTEIITLFVCTATGCDNKDIVYRMVDANPTAICGGCKAILEPQA